MAVAEALRKTITDEDLMRLPKDGRKWELVDREIKEVPTSYKHDEIVIRLGFLMYPYAEDIGGLTASQAGFRMSNRNPTSRSRAMTASQAAKCRTVSLSSRRI